MDESARHAADRAAAGPLVDARGHRYQRPLATMRAYLDDMDAAPWQGPPLQEQPPRVLAALGPRMLALAAERSAGALTYNATPEATAWARSILGAAPLLAVEQAAVVEDDPAEARRIARGLLAFSMTLPNYLRAWERLGFGRQLDAGADHVCLQVLGPDPDGVPMAGWRALAAALLSR